MKQRARIYYTEAQKALMWDRWQKQAMDAVAYRLLEPRVRQLVHAVEQRDRLPRLQVMLQESLIEMGADSDPRADCARCSPQGTGRGRPSRHRCSGAAPPGSAGVDRGERRDAPGLVKEEEIHDPGEYRSALPSRGENLSETPGFRDAAGCGHGGTGGA
jgi:hypothetical protein